MIFCEVLTWMATMDFACSWKMDCMGGGNLGRQPKFREILLCTMQLYNACFTIAHIVEDCFNTIPATWQIPVELRLGFHGELDMSI